MKKMVDSWEEISALVYLSLTVFVTIKLYCMENPTTVHAMCFQVLVGASLGVLGIIKGMNKFAEVQIAKITKQQ